MTILESPPEGAERRYLPVLFDPGVAGADRRGPYVPRHALEAPADRTSLWVWVVLIVTSAFVAGTTAAFSATAADTGNVFGSASLSKPGGQTVTLGGNDLDLVITSFGAFDGTPGGVSYGSRWRYMWPTGVSTSGSPYGCTSSTAAYTNDLGDSATNAKTVDYTDVSGFADGRWMCVMAHTAYPAVRPAAPAQQWYSQQDNPVTSVLLGHVVQSINLQDGGGTGNTMQQNDAIVVTFNQAVEASNRPTSGIVCARGVPKRIFIGPTLADGTNRTNCTTNTPAAVTIGYLDVTGTTSVGTASFTSTTWTWSGDGRQLTITLNTNTSTSITCTPDPGCTRGLRLRMDMTQNPSTALESATPAIGRPLCIATDVDGADNGSCEPDAVGSF